MMIMLTAEERALVLDVLGGYRRTLSLLISRADHRPCKVALRRKADVTDVLIGRLEFGGLAVAEDVVPV